MNWFAQIGALLAFNLRTLPQRKASVASALFGIAGVVAVMVGVLSISRGFARAMTVSGSPDTAVILRAGADSEMTSIISHDDVLAVGEAPGIAKHDGRPIVSPELFVVVNLPKRSTGTDANIPMRGVEGDAFLVRSEVKIVEGRRFEPGKNEVIVGSGAHRQFSGLDVGAKLRFGQNDWTVVGIFSAGGGLAESEIWSDAAVLAPAYRRGSSRQTMLVKLASPASYQQFKDALTADPRVNLKVVRETDYYAEQSRLLYLVITGLGTIVAALMGLGAVFGALNTMYTAVASRHREIATLKALGFSGSPVVFSVVLESAVIAVIGGVIGALVAWLAFDGFQTATMNWRSFSQVVFAFDVDAPLLVRGVVYAVLIGILGGILPAIRAARLPVALALRGD